MSYPPGSFPPNADSIEVHNLTRDLVVGAPMVDGGVDPIAVPSSVGDSLQITVLSLSGTYVLDRVIRAVPADKPPVVVRTDPNRRRTKVPLNARMVIVFSEPIDASTVNSGNIQLLDGDEPIPSTLLRSDDGLFVELAPDSLLQIATTYTISVARGVGDLSGSNLPEAFTSEFTTTAEVGSIHVETTTNNAGNMLPNGYEMVVDGIPGPHMGITDTRTLANLSVGMHEIWIKDIHPNCGSPGVKYVNVRRDETASAYFDISCHPGILHVSYIQTGDGFSHDTYQVSADGGWESFLMHDWIGNGTIYGIGLGPRRLEVTNVPTNCTILGGNQRTVLILEGIQAATTFHMHCYR